MIVLKLPNKISSYNLNFHSYTLNFIFSPLAYSFFAIMICSFKLAQTQDILEFLGGSYSLICHRDSDYSMLNLYLQ